jgi:hypothetical protein
MAARFIGWRGNPGAEDTPENREYFSKNPPGITFKP